MEQLAQIIFTQEWLLWWLLFLIVVWFLKWWHILIKILEKVLNNFLDKFWKLVDAVSDLVTSTKELAINQHRNTEEHEKILDVLKELSNEIKYINKK
jgi:hypothetical protein